MKKKINEGFTLIELLAVIVIIGVVALIAVPTVINSIQESKEKLYTTQVQNIELSAKKWATEYREELDSEYLNSSYVSVQMLRDLGFITKEKLKNPINSEEMLGCVTIAYDSSNKTYTYKYVDENTNCEKNLYAKGYYYTYSEEDGTWHKDLSKQRESIYSYLVGEDASNVVASGNGLYDMEDRYVFRGRIENNYVELDGADYRIISLDKNTKSLKLISLEKNGSGAWGNTTNISLNTTTLYTETINKSLYPSITNKNVKWNIGKITNTDGLNLNAIKAYESSAKIESEIALISMSEYMEASLDETCSAGNLIACANETYLNIPDSWTMTTTESTVVYVDANKGLSYETDLVNNYHNIYRVVNIMAMEKNGDGTISNPFRITSTES